MRTVLALASLALIVAHGGPSAAAEPVDLLFNTPHMAEVAPGRTLRYDHDRASDPALGIGPDLDAVIAVETGDGRATRFVMDADGAPRGFDVSEGVPGNPLLAVFLENTLRASAKATGGSPFYLRNRMREALADRLETVEQDHVFAMRPFAGDANATRLGDFEQLVMTFEVSVDAPGMLVALSAQAGPDEAPVYREEIRLETTD
ncbi:hypothetical protein [Rubrimonas cliftonensis]|uniref:Uncharacterized protein n=1 Tax=Rubrimonas cliftonensis TaxID=89524 RepID=A0A1H4B3L3_9RHOB|nr:hypothetical protein [Rubrimonas cliftonensis]SEA42689.1 hypothetical protein SAMN05444370_1056 [Rubrimonas cliftonensis]